MRKLVAAARGGSVETAARCILALAGIQDPTPEQTAGAVLQAHAYDDLHILAKGQVIKE